MSDKKISQLTVATTPLDGTEVLPIVQSGTTVKVQNNDLRPKQIQSNATSGVLQVVGPAAASTRIMTTPDANFTVARTDVGQTFAGDNTFNGGSHNTRFQSTSSGGYERVFVNNDSGRGPTILIYGSAFAGTSPWGGFPYANITTLLNSTTNAFVFGSSENYPVSFVTNGVEKWRLETTGNLTQKVANTGIDFSANADAAGMTSNLLNWYEEGTWTPALVLTGSVTYTTQRGTYTRVGRLVTIQLYVEVNVATTPSGTLEVSGLPFTVSAGSKGALAIIATGMSASATTTWMGNPTAGTNNLRLYTYAAGNLANPGSYVASGCSIGITGSYEV